MSAEPVRPDDHLLSPDNAVNDRGCGAGDTLIVASADRQETRLPGLDVVTLGGHPIHEPIVRAGPSVMNTEAEVGHALEDDQVGRPGLDPASYVPYGSPGRVAERAERIGDWRTAMSNLERDPGVLVCGGRGDVPAEPVVEVLPGREVVLGESTRVRRLLPTLGRRLIGAWCFIDHYGPDDIAVGPGMQVPPHPHIGLQTVSWLLAGEIHHRDSTGCDALIRPGELALMTAGRAIAHAEQSPVAHPALLHGAQLWVALPEADRGIAPDFTHHTALPVLTQRGMTATVLLGEMAGAHSPGRVFSPLIGVDLALDAGADVVLPLEPDFEHGVLTATGSADVAGARLGPGALLYLGTGRRELRLRTNAPARLLLMGGEPFAEEIVMWWNFLGSSGEEVAGAREAWVAGERFGTVTGYEGDPMPAPTMPRTPLRPRGRTR